MEAKDDFHPILPFQTEPPREHAHTGEWHFDEKNHAYCSAFHEVRGCKEVCFAVFRKPHENKFFYYDIGDSFIARAWCPEK